MCGGNLLRLAAGPENFEVVDVVVRAEANGDGEFGLGKIAVSRHNLTPEESLADADFDPRADRVAVGASANEFHANPVVVKALLVAEEHRGAVDLGHEDVEVDVAVNIRKSGAAADDGLEQVIAAFADRNRDETLSRAFAPRVPKELGGLAITFAGTDGSDLFLNVAIDAEEVEPTVEVIIEEENAEGQVRAAGGADAL